MGRRLKNNFGFSSRLARFFYLCGTSLWATTCRSLSVFLSLLDGGFLLYCLCLNLVSLCRLFFGFSKRSMQHIVTWHQLRFSIRSRTYVPRMKFWFAAGIRSRKRKKSFSFSSESFTRLVFCFMAWNGILQCDLISLYVHIFDANGHKQIELNGTYISFSNKQILCTNLFNIVNVNIVYKAICVYIGFAITFLLLFLSVAAVLLLLFRFHLPVTFYLFIFYIFVLYSRLLYSVYILLLHEYTRICINTSGLCIQT